MINLRLIWKDYEIALSGWWHQEFNNYQFFIQSIKYTPTLSSAKIKALDHAVRQITNAIFKYTDQGWKLQISLPPSDGNLSKDTI